MEHRGLRRFGPASSLLLAAWLACGGCGGAGLAYDFGVPVERRAVLGSADAGDKTLRLPGDDRFNITDKSSRQSPGMQGTARGESEASGAGTADCSVEAAKGGSASAAFHLGHCIANRGEEATMAEAVFTCEYEIKVELEDGPETPTTSSCSMELYVNDTDGRLLKQVPIETSSGDGGPTSGTGRLVKEFRVRLEPKRVYNFVLAGKVEAKTGPAGLADLEIEVKGLQLTVRRERARAAEPLQSLAEPAGSTGAGGN